MARTTRGPSESGVSPRPKWSKARTRGAPASRETALVGIGSEWPMDRSPENSPGDAGSVRAARTVGDGCDAHRLRLRRVGTSGRGDRLPRPRARWVRVARRGRAKEAERALEAACIERSEHSGQTGIPVLRSLDNGLVFGAKVFLHVVRRYSLNQEYITPYSPQQNGMIERFFRTLKEEFLRHQRFRTRDEGVSHDRDVAREVPHERPHSALGYLTPKEFAERYRPELNGNEGNATGGH
jgi:transposase InsO family protein